MNNDFNLLIDSFNNACKLLDLDRDVQTTIVDLKNIAKNLSESERQSITTQCLLLIELYKNLYALSGNKPDFIKHLLNTTNTELNGKPIELIQTPKGLERVVSYYSSISQS